MNEPDELNRRVTRLEHEMVKVRADAAAARVLAGGADRDVSGMRVELRAHTQLLNALRETQVEQGKTLAQLGKMLAHQGQTLAHQGQTLEQHGRMLAQHGKEFGSIRSEMRTGFGTLGVGQAKLVELLTAHLGRSDG